MNLSKSGGSLSFGPRGAKFTMGSRGGRATVGIPGTGLFYSVPVKARGRGTRRSTQSGAYQPSPESRLNLGFFQRLVTPPEERAFVDGCREYVLGEPDRALEHLEKALHLADAAFLAGYLALGQGKLEKAENYLKRALRMRDSLDVLFAKYGLAMSTRLSITDEITALVQPDERGVLLGLVEIYQHQGRWREALEALEQLLRLVPDDVVVKLSLAEILLQEKPHDKRACQRVVQLAEGVENESPVHSALLLYKAKALRALGLNEAARDLLTATLRRKKDRPAELMRALRYERALVYEALGQAKRARSEFEKLYAEAPGYEDVAQRLGLE